jgi:hypothetical protein
MNAPHNPLAITGYRALAEREIELINLVKLLGDKQIAPLVAELRNQPTVEQRWVSIAQTHFQQGLMALARSVAKPTNF